MKIFLLIFFCFLAALFGVTGLTMMLYRIFKPKFKSKKRVMWRPAIERLNDGDIEVFDLDDREE